MGSKIQALEYALERIASRLVSDWEVRAGNALIFTTNGVADLLVFGLFKGGFVGLYPWESTQ